MMREKERIDRMIEKLRLAWHNQPDLRLCQLIWSIAINTNTVTDSSGDVFYVEDDVFEISLNKKFGKVANKK